MKNILLLGDPKLYEVSRTVKQNELKQMRELLNDLQDTLLDFRKKYGAGRAIAAPQIGIPLRAICLCSDLSQHHQPKLLINPVLELLGQPTMEVLDDCMSFPNLLVRVMRHEKCVLTYRDIDWNLCVEQLEGDLAELIQHECDHLDGILATMRAIDCRSFFLKKEHWENGSCKLEVEQMRVT